MEQFSGIPIPFLTLHFSHGPLYVHAFYLAVCNKIKVGSVTLFWEGGPDSQKGESASLAKFTWEEELRLLIPRSSQSIQYV